MNDDDATSVDSPAVHICRINSLEGTKDFATLLPPAVALRSGLDARSIVGILRHPLAEGEELTPGMLTPSSVFVEFMHEVIARHAPAQPDCIAEAERVGTGWVYILDQRTDHPGGSQIPAEDVIGAIQTKDGQIVPGSYQANPGHRILTDAGFFQLPPELAEVLVRELEAQAGTGR